MPYKPQIWCAHPCHDEVLPNGKKRLWKTGPKPTHPKGKRSTSGDLANYINSHNKRILNGNSERLAEDDHLCSTCFDNEQNSWITDQRRIMDVDDCQESCDYNKVDNDPDYHQDSPMEDDCVHYELEDVKRK